MAGLVWQSRRMTANKHENVGIAPDGVKICGAMSARLKLTGVPNLMMTHPISQRIQSLGVTIVSVIVFVLPSTARAATLDRIAAVIDQQVLTVSEVDQMAEVRFIPRIAGRSDDDYHHDILEALIAQALRYRDVERFGAQDIPKDSIEARLVEIQHRFVPPASLDAALLRSELTLDELRALIKRQLQVEAYIQERFA